MTKQETKYRLSPNVTKDDTVAREISDYAENKFVAKNKYLGSLPLSDENYVTTWERYLRESEKEGVFKTLQSYLIQFRFPIQKNISQLNNYRDATLRGMATDKMASASGLWLSDPNSLELFIYQSVAGKIPVLIVPNCEDFSHIVRALSHRNEPVHIPKSMGAAMIKGINNWGRILELKTNWMATNLSGSWSKEFIKNILPTKSLYQDKIIVLSHKPYSGVTSESLGIPYKKWIEHSLKIRLEHECTHFFTLRYYGHMANNMHDELIADYMGISKVLGKFNANWFLKFIGLENYPNYTSGARLENYLGKPSISKIGFEMLKTIVKNAAYNMAEFDESLGLHQDELDRTLRLMSLCSVNLLDIASGHGVKKLIAEYKRNKIANPMYNPKYEE
ncbi:hypothetical protein MNBD_BACTEROID03-1037 [hydrothermal vent metagenome]|uniref:Uncharacterized protein n=1 Tax=hydrothermal vent metagenome TaxID=652676 RepID=A0A3B0TEE0_9ZZZZ